MTSNKYRAVQAAGFSLVELSLVIALMLGLVAFVGSYYENISNWRQGKEAGLALQAVYSAQRAFMADHPTAKISNLTAGDIKAYLPFGWNDVPQIVGLGGENLSLKFDVMPPILSYGGNVYDPSQKANDGLWDAGE